MRLGVEAALVDGELVQGDVEIQGGRISAIGLASPNGRGIAVPGFVDLQVNGFGGVDFLSADTDGYRQAGEALLETGVTSYLPTFITSPEEQLLAALREVPATPDGPRVLGAHLEGPFINRKKKGAQPEEGIRDPDADECRRLLAEADGLIRVITLAPELPGALDLIRMLRRDGIIADRCINTPPAASVTRARAWRQSPPACLPSPRPAANTSPGCHVVQRTAGPGAHASDRNSSVRSSCGAAFIGVL